MLEIGLINRFDGLKRILHYKTRSFFGTDKIKQLHFPSSNQKVKPINKCETAILIRQT